MVIQDYNSRMAAKVNFPLGEIVFQIKIRLIRLVNKANLADEALQFSGNSLHFFNTAFIERASMKAAADRSMSSSVVIHEQTLIRIAGSPNQVAPPHQHSPEF